MRIAARGRTIEVGLEEVEGAGAPGAWTVRVAIRVADSVSSRSSGTRPVRISRAGLRCVREAPCARMLNFSSRTCMPRSGTRLRAAALGGTDERPCCLGWVTGMGQVTEPARGLAHEPAAARLEVEYRAVARRQGDFAGEVSVGVGGCTLCLVLQDRLTSFGGLYVRHVL